MNALGNGRLIITERWFKYKERRGLLGRGVLSNAFKKEVVPQIISPVVLLCLPNQSPSLLHMLRLICEPPQAKAEGGAPLASKSSLNKGSPSAWSWCSITLFCLHIMSMTSTW